MPPITKNCSPGLLDTVPTGAETQPPIRKAITRMAIVASAAM